MFPPSLATAGLMCSSKILIISFEVSSSDSYEVSNCVVVFFKVSAAIAKTISFPSSTKDFTNSLSSSVIDSHSTISYFVIET